MSKTMKNIIFFDIKHGSKKVDISPTILIAFLNLMQKVCMRCTSSATAKNKTKIIFKKEPVKN